MQRRNGGLMNIGLIAAKNKKLFGPSPVWDKSYAKKTDREKQQMRDTSAESGIGFDL